MKGTDKQHSIRFRLAIPSELYLSYYRGEVQDVQVVAANNQKIRFPASAIQKFLTQDGIYGVFEIYFDASCKLIGIERIATHSPV